MSYTVTMPGVSETSVKITNVAKVPVWDHRHFDKVTEDTDSILLSDCSSPLSVPVTRKLGSYKLANIYKNLDVASDLVPTSKVGHKLTSSITETVTCTGSNANEKDFVFPISVGIQITIPHNALVTEDQVNTVINHALAGFYELDATTGNVAKSRIINMARGAYSPV